jgi:predicted nucleic acid-binding protein
MVVDASAVLSFLLPDEKDSAEAIVIRNALCDASTFFVPAHW